MITGKAITPRLMLSYDLGNEASHMPNKYLEIIKVNI